MKFLHGSLEKREQKDMPSSVSSTWWPPIRVVPWYGHEKQNEIQSNCKDQIHNPQKIKLPLTTPIPPSFVKPWHDSMTVWLLWIKKWGKFSSNCKRMDWLRILSCSLSDPSGMFPSTNVSLLDSGMHVPLLILYPKNGSILPKSNHGKQPTGW